MIQGCFCVNHCTLAAGKTSPSLHPERVAVGAPPQNSCQELNEVLLGQEMGNRESKDAASHAARAAEQEQKVATLAAKSDAQGGRWIESATVESEPTEGYGVAHHHTSQKAQPEVAAAVALGHEPGIQARVIQTDEARAVEQGGRWLSQEPRGGHTQQAQPEVQQAIKAAHDPTHEAEEAKREQARHIASGGRW